jgi:amidohydrolase
MSTKATAQTLSDQLIEWRRHLHMHPELSYEEHATSAFVRERLGELGVETSPPIAGGTGLTALIRGKHDGPTVGLRADMDALPIQQESAAPYASKRPGVAHMCGHDAHTTMLLGAAALLSAHRPERGNVKLFFQPAEEGGAGAARMIEDGAMENPKVEAIFALHVFPGAPVGHFTATPGPATAASDSIDLEIIGRGGHAAHPHQAIDAIAVAAQVVGALQLLVSRQRDPLKPLVITIGKMEGGFARNVIAPSVRLQGTVRSLDADLRQRLPQMIDDIVRGVTSAFGASHTLEYTLGYPSTINDPGLLPLVNESVAAVVGDGRLTLVPPSMGGEDFSYYAEKVPGFMLRIGVRNEARGIIHPLHNPLFDLDEAALPLGAALLSDLATRYLKGTSS